MTRILAIANQKGGVGKTTTSINLAAGLSRAGKRVLLVDLDPQGNATMGSGIDKRESRATVYEVLLGDRDIESARIHCENGGFDLVAANQELAGAEGLKHITLISPSTPPARVQMLAAQSEGFIYALSRMGVTGAQQAPSASIGELVSSIRQHTDTPVCVGFGISSPDQAATVAAASDGVVVGSAIVSQVAENAGEPKLAEMIQDFTTPLITATKKPSTP